MRQALARWTEPLVAWLPDLRQLPLRRQATYAVVASALLHFVLLCLAAIFLAISPDPVEFAKAKPKVAPLEIELLPPPPPPPEPKSVFPLSEPEPPPVIDSTGLAKADQPPAKATFQSDQDMVAASEKPGTGDIPLPSMEGRTDRPTPNFTTQRAEVGAPGEAPGPTVALAAPPVAPSSATPATPPPPLFQPQPIKPANDPAPAATPAPAPPPEPAATPRPRKTVVEPRPDEIAFRQAPPIPPPPRPSPLAKLEPAPATPAPPIMPPTKPEPLPEMAKLVTPAPPKPPPSKSGYQAQQEKTKIEGNISNRGKAAVDAVRTPLGVYQRQISQAVGSRWNYYVKQRMDLVTVGETRVTFHVTKLGRVENVRVVDNTANESFSQVCQRSVMEAELSPPPDGLLDAMPDGRLEITFTFNLYSN